MRHNAVVILFLASALVSCVYALRPVPNQPSGNSYVFGVIGATDVVINRQTIRRRPRLGQVTTENYVFTQAAAPKAITGIRITDRKVIGGASAAITAGGPGANTVTVTFTSQRSGPIDSILEIFAAP